MSKAPTIAKLSASVDIGNGIESVNINMAINTVATATLNLGHKGDEVVVEPLASDILSTIRGYQKKRLAGVSKPDVTLHVDDDIYGTMNMNGYLAAPMLEISDAHIGFQAAILDQAAMLDGLDLSIYKNALDMLRQGEIPDEIPRPDGNVGKLLLELTNVLVKNYDNALAKETDPVMKEVITMRHELNNSGPLEIWRSILGKTRVVHESWSAMKDLHENAGKHISYKTMDMLCMKSSGFWNVLNALMSAFQMFYRPEPGSAGSYGRLMNNKDKVDDPEGELELDIVNLNVRDGSTRILQVGGVIMEAGSAAGLRNEEIPGATTPSVAGVYPEKILKGYIHNEIPPVWLIDANGAPVLGSAEDKKKDTEPGSDKPNLSLPGYQSRKEGGKKHLEKFEKSRSAVMTELCEYTFKELQLADSVMSAKLPLNLTIEIGKRKTIKLGDSGSVTGFIAAVSHHIDLRQGKELDSFSQVTITHVEY